MRNLPSLLPLWLAASLACAQTDRSTADLVGPLDTAGAGARPAAMGSAYAAGAGWQDALFFNPSGLASLQGGQIALHHYSGFAGLHREWLNVANSLSPGRAAALSFNYLGYGSLERRDESGLPIGEQNPYRMGFTLAGGASFAGSGAVGASIDALYQTVPGDEFTTVRFGGGAQWCVGRSLRLGLSGRGWGPYTAGHRPPFQVQAGAMLEPVSKTPFCLALDLVIRPLTDYRGILAGCELPLNPWLFFRAGSQLALRGDRREGFHQLTSGVGYRSRAFSMDYAFIPEGELGTTHRISLTHRFRAPEDRATSGAPGEAPAAATTTPTPTSLPAGDAAASVMPTPTVPVGKLKIYFKLPPKAASSAEADERIQQLELRIKKTNTDAAVWWELGLRYERSGRTAEARQCYQQVLRLIPGQHQAVARLKALPDAPSPTP